jgi:RHS repeat-associated protein
VARYEHSDDGAPLARFDASTSTAAYFLHDAQGSVRQLATAAASITDAITYSAFGRTLAATGSSPSPYRYGGQWEEPRSGLYHLRARWMDPASGRFVSTDPFTGVERSSVSLHRYLYAHGNPATYADPRGLFSGGLDEQVQVQGIQNSLRTQTLPNLTRLLRPPAQTKLMTSTEGLAEGIALTAFAAWGSRRQIRPAEVIFDTNILFSGQLFMTAIGMTPPGATPVLTTTIVQEALEVSRRRGLRIFPPALALKVVPDAASGVAMARLRPILIDVGVKPNAPGLRNDLIIGATGAETFRRVCTNDRRFAEGMNRAFGPVAAIWVPLLGD